LCDHRSRVLEGLKHRLLTPELVEEFVASYLAEVSAANRDRGQRQAQLRQEQGRLSRQIRNLIELAKDGGGTKATLDELRILEGRQDELAQQISAADQPEEMPALHPNLPQVYRLTVEQLESALRDPAAEAGASEALRLLIDAILVFPETGRGQVRIELRGDLAAFMGLLLEPRRAAAGGGAGFAKRSGVMGTLVAGTRNTRSRRNSGQNANGAPFGAPPLVSQESLVAGARNTRFLRLVERAIPKLAA
jgi:site-specific DNA recombinase